MFMSMILHIKTAIFFFIEHYIGELIIIFILCVFALFSYIYKRHLRAPIRWIHQLPDTIKHFFSNKNARHEAQNVATLALDEYYKYKSRTEDTLMHINALKGNDSQKKFVAIQYLIQNPSNLGVKALVDFASSINQSTTARRKFFRVICESINNDHVEWHEISLADQ